MLEFFKAKYFGFNSPTDSCLGTLAYDISIQKLDDYI